ncbi:alpha-ribazole phosphatase [Dysgonomonas macrotermitis]|uniref:Alpha-ribazole phosphatase n=1 Tax=Dysgonomonas macrotermitis TaxID=1346286 RepID=A0A1M5FIM5_9BACT|nr:alpha-ribazole phosphatase [Dysgonomonas macrotermitis]SHF91346.1 alpha-ribazole phosphatase [Dysgonomonas macrotermitis]
MELFFVRHTSVNVPKGICYGQSNVPVCETFEEEAEAVKLMLAGVQFEAVYSSPLSRCRKLARYCGFEDRMVLSDRLKEMYFGEWEMKEWHNIDDGKISLWYEDWINHPAEGGESFRMLYGRVASFIDEIKVADFSNVLIFAHGGVINCARVYAGITTFDKAFDSTPAYGEIVRIKI